MQVVPVSDRGPRGIAFFANMPSLMVKQTRRGCFQEMFGCEAKNEFNISTIENPQANILYSLEESSFCCRFIMKNHRASEQKVWVGNNAGLGDAALVMSAKKDCTLGLEPCQCCCNPYMNFTDGVGGPMGSVKVPMFCCIPTYKVFDETGQPEYEIHQPKCCGGMCVNACAEGCCNCKVPYYIYAPNQEDRGKGMEKGKIIKIWRGMATEFFSDADTFTINFPADATPEQKARVLGSTFLLNMMEFEGKPDRDNGGSLGAPPVEMEITR
jgi:hypothetical protein